MKGKELLSNLLQILYEAETESLQKTCSNTHILILLEEVKRELVKYNTMKSELKVLAEKIALDLEKEKKNEKISEKKFEHQLVD